MATGFGYQVEQRRAQGAVVAALLPRVRDIRRHGSSALDLCSVAAGRVDAYYELDLKPWDHAAGALVAAEAGLVVSGLDGRPFAEPDGGRGGAVDRGGPFLDLLTELHALRPRPPRLRRALSRSAAALLGPARGPRAISSGVARVVNSGPTTTSTCAVARVSRKSPAPGR